jgi:hypothetical protein
VLFLETELLTSSSSTCHDIAKTPGDRAMLYIVECSIRSQLVANPDGDVVDVITRILVL